MLGERRDEHDGREEELRLQVVPERELRLHRRQGAQAGRVLLRADLHVWPRVRVPELVRVSGDQGQVS